MTASFKEINGEAHMERFLKSPFAYFLLIDGDTNAVWRMPLNLIMPEKVVVEIVISIQPKSLKMKYLKKRLISFCLPNFLS